MAVIEVPAAELFLNGRFGDSGCYDYSPLGIATCDADEIMWDVKLAEVLCIYESENARDYTGFIDNIRNILALNPLCVDRGNGSWQVWDGHHRLLVAFLLDLNVLVDVDDEEDNGHDDFCLCTWCF